MNQREFKKMTCRGAGVACCGCEDKARCLLIGFDIEDLENGVIEPENFINVLKLRKIRLWLRNHPDYYREVVEEEHKTDR